MGSGIRIFPTRFTHRWWLSFPFVLAFLTLVFIIWIGYQIFQNGYDGLDLRPTGLVSDVDLTGPAYGLIQPGDKIVSVNGKDWANAIGYNVGTRAGDMLSMAVDRNGKNISVSFRLIELPLAKAQNFLFPIFLASMFWVVGVAVLAFTPTDSVARIFFFWCLGSAIFFVSGAGTYQGPAWLAATFSFLTWLIGPLSVHLHLRFPQNSRIPGQQYWLLAFYLVAILGGLPYLVLGISVIRSLPLYPIISAGGRIFLAANLIVVVGLLINGYQHAHIVGTRGKIRIVVLGGALSAVPIVSLTIIPDALIQQAIIPYSFAFIILSILPLTYGYAIFRHRLIEIEKHINRGATFILVFSILGAFYLVFYTIAHRLLAEEVAATPLVNTLLVLALASVFAPIQKRVQHFVDTLFYGGWYDYKSAISIITQGLEQTTELRALAEQLGARLVDTLHLEDACVFLRDINGTFAVIEVTPKSKLDADHPLSFARLPRSSLNYLLRIGEVERASLQKALSEVKLSPEEHQLLSSEQTYLWVPIIGHGQLQGLMALGPKIGGDIFSGEDLDILRVVARQLGPVVENIHLLNRLRQHAAELEQRVKERTAELYDAKERVEAILASVGDGVVVTDLQGHIQRVNSAFEDQTGYPERELIGKDLSDLIASSTNADVLEEMTRALAEGHTWSGELVAETKHQEDYDVQLTMAPVRDQGGRIVSYVGSQRDITRQKELERLKDQFVSDVSHELRTPTTNIGLFLELLEDAPPERRKEYLRIVREQAQLVRKLVEDVLDLSRLAIGKTRKIEFTRVNLNEVTEQVVNAHLPMAEAAGLELRFVPETDLPCLFGEQNQLARLITNLVTNSVRYTLHGTVIVRTLQKNGCVSLSVEDSGIGIEPEDMPHLFDRFYRGKQVRQSKIHGTGLGLAIVKEIVDLHEGEIEIQSQVGKGSTFNVNFPILQQPSS
jgi:two-component system NtrC family sensor kinase